MYTRNNKGPKMDPCGTLVVIGFDLINFDALFSLPI